ncbi:MAG: cupin domain-containing protein, partial [Planctomycetes bacterium]|nr:cupin domain-containing protein [Planctomycetota bacterium]
MVAGAGGYPLRLTTQSHWPFAWHFHPELELTWIKRGQGLRYVGESVEAFAAGDLVLIGPGIPHTWTSQPQPQPGQDCV